DEVLATAARGIAEVITHHYTQNIDLRDAKTVLSNSGSAIMGSASAAGGSRAQEAIIKALDSPLLNYNKITGAKNVLLLIVSGAEEITLDEIGEINDYIQNEAGNSANIIMGVGEDESLGEAISVTIIATGFNAEVQHEIVNTEAKRIIHTLEDEQKIEHDLSPKTSAPVVKPSPVIRKDDIKKEEVKDKKENVIKHTLFEEKPEVELIPTSEFIKNLNVVYEEVSAKEDDFIIINTTAKIRDIEVVDPEFLTAEEDNQIALSFDLPLSEMEEEKDENVILFDLTEEIKNYEVKDAIEVVPVTEVSENGEIRYSLDDYMEMESVLDGAKPKEKETEVIEEELQFEKKVTQDEEE